MQNDREKFKENFVNRLIKFSIATMRLSEEMKSQRILWPVVDQLIRSSTSIGANVVEAKSSSSKRDYLHYFEIALKSANETKYWLLLTKEYSPEYSTRVEFLYKEACEISNIIGSSVLTLKGKN